MKAKTQRRLITVAMIVILAGIFAITTDSFFTVNNILLLLKESAYTGLIALGLCFVMVGGGVDLSAGGIVCIVGVVAARASTIPGINGIFVVLLAVLAGALCGLLNGFLVTRLHLTEFVTTIATGSVFTGLALVTTFHENGRIVSKLLTNRSFLAWGKTLGGMYWISIAWILLFAVMQVIFTKTKFGTYVTAQGSHSKAAGMSGVNNSRVKLLSFVICGACAGLAAAFTVAYQNTTTMQLGTSMEFQGICACVVGGVVMGGGHGDALSAFLGAIFVTLISNCLYKLGVSTGLLSLFQGLIIIAITNFDTLFGRATERKMRKAAELAVGGDRNE